MIVEFNHHYLGWLPGEMYSVGDGKSLGLGQAKLLIARGLCKVVAQEKPKRKRRKRAPSQKSLRKNDNSNQPNRG